MVVHTITALMLQHLLLKKAALKKLDPSAVEASELAGEKIVDKLTNALAMALQSAVLRL